MPSSNSDKITKLLYFMEFLFMEERITQVTYDNISHELLLLNSIVANYNEQKDLE